MASVVFASPAGVLGLLSDRADIVAAGADYIRIMGHSYLCLFPGLAIMLTVMAFNMVGDGLRDAMDPKLKN